MVHCTNPLTQGVMRGPPRNVSIRPITFYRWQLDKWKHECSLSTSHYYSEYGTDLYIADCFHYAGYVSFRKFQIEQYKQRVISEIFA